MLAGERMTNTTRILGLDPGLRRTGWGVVDVTGARLAWVAHGVIVPPEAAPFADRLRVLFDAIEAVIAEHRPDEAAVEETYVNNNAASALKLGHARAAALIAPARAGLSVAEYAPTVIKKALVGTGGADKAQVAFMVRRLLPACGEASADCADALAVAVTHASSRRARRLGAAA
jgi:crossover junction endodeoxyribonuclease RuvC